MVVVVVVVVVVVASDEAHSSPSPVLPRLMQISTAITLPSPQAFSSISAGLSSCSGAAALSLLSDDS